MEGSSSGLVLGLLIFIGLSREVVPAKEDTALDLDSFSVFGHVQVHPGNFSRKLCSVHVSVQLDTHEWKRELAGEFYLFKVSANRYMGVPGLVDASVRTDLQEVSLWRRVFIVDDTGGYQADAVLTLPGYLNCSAPRTDEKNDVHAAGMLAPVTASTSFHELAVCPSLTLPTCPSLGSKSDASDAEFRELLPETEEPESEGGTQDSYIIFGIRCLRPWQLAGLTVAGAVVHLHVLLLKGFISSTLGSTPPEFCSNEHPAAPWELCTFTSASKNTSRQRDVLASGTSCFNKAWSDAEQLLWQRDQACFSYNCSSGKNNKRWGKWNRDGFGRLIRS